MTAASYGGKRAPRTGEALWRAVLPGRGRLARTDLGEKQLCPSCGAKFYDLCRRPAVCPKCTNSFDPAEEGVRARRGRARVAAHDTDYEDDEDEEAAAKKAKVGAEDEDEEADPAVEIDVEAEAEPVLADDEVEETVAGDELPEGFSEEEADLGEDAADDDSVPLLEDEEEFPEDEIGELPADDDDDSGR